MDTISQLNQEIARYDADALYYTGRAEHCRHEAALLRQELAQEQARKRLDEAQVLATTILELDGLTGAERDAAERVVFGWSCSSLMSPGFALSRSIIRSLPTHYE